MGLRNNFSVTEFQRSPKDILGKLKETKGPIVLTVNGKAEYVVQDVASYQEMIDKLEAVEDLEAVLEGYAQAEAGELTPFEGFDGDFRTRHGV